jgi:DNA polymerase-4
MRPEINQERPQIMHIDLNSAFATAEQQAHPSLRGKPIGVTNRISKYCCVIAASYEAKQRGVKVGMRLDEVKILIPEFIILETDPPKYHHVYKTLLSIMSDYSPNVKMKSIDEGVIDFHGTNALYNRSLVDIAKEIKLRVATEIGNYTTINVGIGPNRFLAKTAANMNKPDGLNLIDHNNLKDIYQPMKLTDLFGIANHFEARLNAAGIFTPLEFFNATGDALKRRVFHSVIGEDWYMRLHGYEVDDVTTKLGSVGRQFALDTKTADEKILIPRFHYLCETTAKKLRYNNLDARGILVWANYKSGDNWYTRKMFKTSFYTDKDIYERALYLFNQRPRGLTMTIMGITCYKLKPSLRNQIGLFDEINKPERLTTALDDISSKYGNFVVGPADIIQSHHIVKQKIPFGSTRYFELLLQSSQQSKASNSSF